MSQPTTEAKIENLVIIGSGPAAWTAAVYAARASLDPLVFEGEPMGTMLPGGQLMTTTEVENFPGFPEGVTGPELMERMKAQATRFGVRAVQENVQAIDMSASPFRLTPSYSAPVAARTVIVATGANAKWLNLPNEQRLAQTGGGVSACAVCDGALPFYRGKTLAVVGGGDLLPARRILYVRTASRYNELGFGRIRKRSPNPRRRSVGQPSRGAASLGRCPAVVADFEGGGAAPVAPAHATTRRAA